MSNIVPVPPTLGQSVDEKPGLVHVDIADCGRRAFNVARNGTAADARIAAPSQPVEISAGDPTPRPRRIEARRSLTHSSNPGRFLDVTGPVPDGRERRGQIRASELPGESCRRIHMPQY